MIPVLFLLLVLVDAYPNNTTPLLFWQQIVEIQGYESKELTFVGKFLQNTTNITIGGRQCIPTSTDSNGYYSVNTAPCRLTISRNTMCTTKAYEYIGGEVGDTCESDPSRYICQNTAYYTGYSHNISCETVTPQNACTILQCESNNIYCNEVGIGYYNLNGVYDPNAIKTAGLQCDVNSACNAVTGKCTDARGPECLSNVTCIPQGGYPVGEYNITLYTPLGNSTIPSTYIILPPPLVDEISTYSNSINLILGDNASLGVVASPSSLITIIINATFLQMDANMSIDAFYLQDNASSTGWMQFTDTLPSVTLPLDAISSSLSFGVSVYSWTYAQTFLVDLPIPLIYIKTPTLFTLCPGIALAYTQTVVIIQGSFFYNYTDTTRPHGYLQCLFGGVIVPSILVSSTELQCIISPTNASVALETITVTNDGGNVYSYPPLYVNILGSCQTLKPNSVPVKSECVCQPGYQDAGYACIPCDIGQYQPNFNQQACIPCAAAQTTITSKSTSSTSCVCRQGFFNSNNVCEACPTGLYCNEGGGIGTLPGYWRDSQTSLTTAPCVIGGDVCAGGKVNASANELCAMGYEGPVCSVCSTGYGRIGSACVKCSNNSANAAVLFFLLMAIIVVLAILVKYTTENRGPSKRGDENGSVAIVVKILFSYSQILYYIGNLSVNWSKQSVTFFNIFIPLSLSPSFAAVQCATHLTFYGRMIVVMLTPIIVATGIALFFLSTVLFPWKCVITYFELSVHSYYRYLLAILYLVHPMISHEVLLSMKCISVRGVEKKTFLQTDMNVDCTSPEYKGYLTIAVLYLIMYVVGFPLIVGLGMIRQKTDLLRMKNQGEANDNAHKYLYFVRGYKDNNYLWEFAILARKLFIVATSLFSDTMMQLTWSGIAVCASIMATIARSPYDSVIDNRSDIIALVALWCSIILAIHSVEIGSMAQIPVFVFLVLVNVIAIVLILLFSLKRFKKLGASTVEKVKSCFPASSSDGDIKMYEIKSTDKSDIPPPPPMEPPINNMSNSHTDDGWN